MENPMEFMFNIPQYSSKQSYRDCYTKCQQQDQYRACIVTPRIGSITLRIPTRNSARATVGVELELQKKSVVSV
ncbi:hypothetical protein GmHk_05G013607 [Glycine max]|nr:hypothetical protein GmHk_05G013607 [Glycine max]